MQWSIKSGSKSDSVYNRNRRIHCNRIIVNWVWNIEHCPFNI